jgi:lysophospholipase L1-like esterase
MQILETILDKIMQEKEFTIAFWWDSLVSTERIHPNFRDIIEYVLKSELEPLVLARFQSWAYTEDSFAGQYLPWEDLNSYKRRPPSRNIRFLNLARDGSTTRDRLQCKDRRLEKHANIDLLLVMGTANDIYYNLPFDETSTNLESLFAYFRELDRVWQALFIPSPYPYWSSENVINEKQRYGDIVEKAKDILQSDRGFSLWDETQKLSDEEYKSFFGMENSNGSLDRDHPNILGNAYIAQQFLQHIFGIAFDYKLYVKEVLEQKHKFPLY